MKQNNLLPALPTIFKSGSACALVIGCLFWARHCEAATAVGSASATVIDSTPIIVNFPTLTPALTSTVFTIQSFTESLSTSGPLLRVGVTPPAPETGATSPQLGAGTGGAPPAASTAAVTVTRNADGSLAVSGGTALTFAVSQPAGGPVNIEYN
jgi:hypothetical protein